MTKSFGKTFCIIACLLGVIAYVSNSLIETKSKQTEVLMESHIIGINNDLLDAYEFGDPDSIKILMELDSMSDDIVDANVFYNLSTFFYIFHLQLIRHQIL